MEGEGEEIFKIFKRQVEREIEIYTEKDDQQIEMRRARHGGAHL